MHTTPFRLTRYFSAVSLIGIIVVMIGLGFYYDRLATDALIDQQTRANAELTRAYANTVWPRHGDFVESAGQYGTDELRSRPETQQLREAVLTQMSGTNVVKVKIYNLSGLTVFSTEPAQIGDDKRSNGGFLGARAGETISELTYREQFSAFEEVISDRDVLSSYVPVFSADGSTVVAVFEVYSDVTGLVAVTETTRTQVVLVVGGSLLLLYLFLLLIVRRADMVLREREGERLEHLKALQAANDAIQEANEGLEAQVELRTSKLRKAMEDAQAANTAKSQFLATMSHEIRTPINGLLGMTELLMDTDLDQDQTHLSTTIRRSGAALLSVINDVLDLSKIEAGKLQVAETWFDLRELVTNTEQIFLANAGRRGISFECECLNLADGAVYKGDPALVRQVLTNLMDNAVKFTRVGEVRLRVGAEPEDSGLTRVTFAVDDTGIGVSEEARDRIFEAFAQADGSTTRNFGGTGLGLAICQQLAMAMGGDIGVESDGRTGSTFWFSVPLLLDEQRAPRLPAESTSRGASPLTGRVLVAEDNPVNREVARRQLEALGCEVHQASNGVAAANAAAETRFDAILMDWHMPEMDGLDAARAIREYEVSAGRAAVPIIAVTANAFDADREQCIDAGMNDYLSKPFTRGQLRSVLEPWLDSCPAGPGASPVDDLNALESAPDGRSSVLDASALNQIRDLEIDGEPSILASVIRVYLDTSPDHIGGLTEGLDRADHRAIEFAAHTLKSSSANVGAVKLSTTCALLEDAARNRAIDQYGPLVADVEQQYRLVCGELSGMIESSQPQATASSATAKP